VHVQKPPLLKTLAAGEVSDPAALSHLLLTLRGHQSTYCNTLLKLREQYVPGGLLKAEVDEVKASLWERSKRVALQGKLKQYNLRRFVRDSTPSVARVCGRHMFCWQLHSACNRRAEEPQVQDVHTHLQAVQCKWLVL
jgi:hypothetical protein